MYMHMYMYMYKCRPCNAWRLSKPGGLRCLLSLGRGSGSFLVTPRHGQLSSQWRSSPPELDAQLALGTGSTKNILNPALPAEFLQTSKAWPLQ